MIIVADTSPLIFLSKIRKLNLIRKVLGHDIRVPRVVVGELTLPHLDPIEKEVIESFLGRCKIEPVRNPRHFAKAMSAADNAALTLPLRSKANFFLCDDRIVRAMAEIEGIRPMGTLGLLIRAARKQVLPKKEVRQLIDLLVSQHNLRIGIEIYQAAMKELT